MYIIVSSYQIRLLLLPSVDNFETQFIAALNDDLVSAHNCAHISFCIYIVIIHALGILFSFCSMQKSTDVIKIEERRLRVCDSTLDVLWMYMHTCTNITIAPPNPVYLPLDSHIQFMPYNGWNFSSSSIITYLEKVSLDTPLHHTGSLKLHHSAHNHLVFRGSVELMDLVPHPLMEVVLQLEYVVTWTSPSLQSKVLYINELVHCL